MSFAPKKPPGPVPPGSRKFQRGQAAARLASLDELEVEVEKLIAAHEDPSGIELDAPPSPSTVRRPASLESVGPYHVLETLGEGGMGEVYLAEQFAPVQRKVALKVLKPELAAVVGGDRFLAEIATTANLQHPHILPLFDSGEAGSFLYYVMPYIQGESLGDRLKRERQLPVDEALRIATDLAEALDYAHRRGVIHRDIKPANIMMNEGRPLIADFGIALAVGSAGGARLTETGLSVGTPYYMSPEQGHGGDVDERSDIYSLGVIFYELLTGEKPFKADTAMGIIYQHANAPVPVLPARVAQHQALINMMLAKAPADRLQSAAEIEKWL